MMIRRKNLSRTSADVRDRVQVRVVRKRLKLTDEQLSEFVRKTRSSTAPVSREPGARRCLSLPKHAPPAALIAATGPEAAASMQVEVA